MVSMTVRAFALGGLVVLFALSCAPQKKTKNSAEGKLQPGKAGSDSQLLSNEDLAKPLGIASLEKAEVIEKLSDMSELFGGKAEEGLSHVDQCMQRLLDQLKVDATKTVVWVRGEVDSTSCFNRTATTSATMPKFDAVRSQFLFRGTCAGRDLSTFSGKKYSELRVIEGFACESAAKTLQAKTIGKITAVTSAGNLTSDITQIYSYDSEGKDGCIRNTKSGFWTSMNECIEINKTSFKGTKVNGKPREDLPSSYSKLSQSNLKSSTSDTAVWHESGSFKVIINDWNGTITYPGNGRPPTYQMSNGSQSASGLVQKGVGLRGIQPLYNFKYVQ